MSSAPVDLHSDDIVIVDAVRSPVGRRGGDLSGIHPSDLLSDVLTSLMERTQVDPASIGQLVGGCVSQAGEQTANIARTAWLGAGYPLSVAATTVDAQCGSSQQATTLAYGLVRSGVVESAIGCGVESMTRNPMGSSYKKGQRTATSRYKEHYEYTTQFQGAELMAKQWGISREECDAYGLRSQSNAARRGKKTVSAPRSSRSTRRCSTRTASPPTRSAMSCATAASGPRHPKVSRDCRR